MKFRIKLTPQVRSRLRSVLMVAAMLLLNTLSAFAQAGGGFNSTDLRTGISNGLAVIMMFGFVLGIAAVIYGGFAIRNAPATPELKAFVQELAARAERLKTGRVDPSEDNMLKITSEGRKAALDLRLMKPTTRDEPQGKVNQAVENIHRIWQPTTVERSAQ